MLERMFDGAIPETLSGEMMRTSDVAKLFEVSERTVSEWARRGRLPSVQTPGGHRRYPTEAVLKVLEESRKSSEP